MEGGERVTLYGRFDIKPNDTVMIYFGIIPATYIEQATSTTIVCYTPPRLVPGKVKVTGVIQGKQIFNDLEFRYERVGANQSCKVVPRKKQKCALQSSASTGIDSLNLSDHLFYEYANKEIRFVH